MEGIWQNSQDNDIRDLTDYSLHVNLLWDGVALSTLAETDVLMKGGNALSVMASLNILILC